MYRKTSRCFESRKLFSFISYFLLSIFIFNLTINPVSAINLPFLRKKQEPPREKMVETVQQWEQESQSIPLHLRELKEYSPIESNKKFYYPTPYYIFDKYNYPAGTREVNIETIKKELSLTPYLVADSKFEYVAYSRFYYLSEYNQISSAFFVEKLDTTKKRKDRLLNYTINQEQRIPVVEVGNKKIYKNLYNGLSLVDWSKDSKKVLFKEKIGSLEKGIYKTYLYVYFLDDDNPYTIKLDNFDRAIKNYFLDWQNIQLVKYRYDIAPLGFSGDNDDIIVCYCYAVDNENNKVFLGIWGYDLLSNQTLLISKKMLPLEISSNGIYLKQKLD